MFAKSILIVAVCLPFILLGQPENPVVLIKTELGNIKAEIYLNQAPVTASNFLRYVKEKRYKGALFYRVVRQDNQPNNDVKIKVIQGGLFEESKNELPPIVHESTKQTGILHKDGTLSMARGKAGTASSEFFICIDHQPELDYGGKRNKDGEGFAAFGKVIEGMDLVRKINSLPNKEQYLIEKIKILDVTLFESKTN